MAAVSWCQAVPILYHPQLFEGDIILTKNAEGRNAVSDPDKLWPHAAIIYKVDESVGCPHSYQCDLLMNTLDYYQQTTCIRFQQWTGQPNYTLIFFNTRETVSCWSNVGMTGGEQQVSLALRCWYKGILLHELGHTLGLYHEMNRPDRDRYITILWQNIIPEYEPAFAKYQDWKVNTLDEPFDLKSVMLYDEFAFSKDNVSPTVLSKNGQVIGPIWKKSNLSRVDLRRIHKLYSCKGMEPKAGFPQDVTCRFDRHSCGFMSLPHSSSWTRLNGGYMLSTYQRRGGYLVSPNLHPVSSADPRGAHGCIHFYYFIQADREASLKVFVDDLDKTTSLSFNPDTFQHLWQSNSTHLNRWNHIHLPFNSAKPFKMPKKVRIKLTMPKRSQSSRQGKVKSSTDSVQSTKPLVPTRNPRLAALQRRNLTLTAKVEDSAPVRRSTRGSRAIEPTSSHQHSEILVESSSSDGTKYGPSVETSPSTLSLEVNNITVPSLRRSVRVRTNESGSKSLSQSCSHGPS